MFKEVLEIILWTTKRYPTFLPLDHTQRILRTSQIVSLAFVIVYAILCGDVVIYAVGAHQKLR